MKLSFILLSLALSSLAHAEGGGVAGNGGGNFFASMLAHLEANHNDCSSLTSQFHIKVEDTCSALKSKVMTSSKSPNELFTLEQYRFYEICCQADQL